MNAGGMTETHLKRSGSCIEFEVIAQELKGKWSMEGRGKTQRDGGIT